MRDQRTVLERVARAVTARSTVKPDVGGRSGFLGSGILVGAAGSYGPPNFLDPIETILKGGAKFLHSSFKFRCARVLLGVGKRYAKRLASFTDCGILQTKDCCTIGKRRIVPLWWQ